MGRISLFAIFLIALITMVDMASAQISILTADNVETECNAAIERANKDTVAIDGDVAILEKGAATIKVGKVPTPLSPSAVSQPLVMQRLKDLSFCIQSAALYQKPLVVLHADEAKNNLWASWFNLVLALLHVQSATTDGLKEAGAACFALHPSIPSSVTVIPDLRPLTVDCQTFHIPGSSITNTTCDAR